MIETVVTDELSTDWEHTSTVGEGDDIGEEPVAVHEDGAAIFVDEALSNDPADHIASLSYPVTVGDITADIVVATESFVDKHKLLGFVRKIGDAVTDGKIDPEAFVVVPHEGSPATVAIDPIVDEDYETIAQSKLADVFCIDTSDLSPDVDLSDVYENKLSFVYHIYGLDRDTTIDDPTESVSTDQAAHDSISLDIYTITAEEMSLIDADE